MQTLDDAATVAEAVVLLGQPRRTVLDRVRRGEIPSEKLPGKTGAYLLDRATVEALAAEPE